MSDRRPADHGESRIQDFIFSRELAEIYLLLDNVSTSAGKSLPPPPAPAKGGKHAKPAPPDVISEICAITWPPSGSKTEQAEEAAALIRARDTLNGLAAPATGATIAFTLLVSGEDSAPAQERGGLGGWFRGLGRTVGLTPTRPHRPAPAVAARAAAAAHHEPAAEPEPAPVHTTAARLAPSRLSLARQAFPNLVRRADGFRLLIRWGILALFLLFVGTALLSWNIAAGNGVLAEWNKIEADKAAIIQPATGEQAGAKDALGRKLKQNERDLRFACVNLRGWLEDWAWLGYPATVVPGATCAAATNDPEDGVNAQWGAALLNVLGGAVLPIFYGLLGASASVVRQLSQRIRDSLLAPRHLMLSLVQLTLGAVIGGCIGLFVTPSGAPSSAAPGLLGSVPLSASALCFIAGFGVEGVFQALESLIRRVFNLPEPNAKP